MAAARRPLDPATARRWAAAAQVRFLKALMGARTWRLDQLAFQGGTSLHLSWRSARFSEDLDFLLNRSVRATMPGTIRAIEKRLKEQFVADDPVFEVEVRDKTRDGDRMLNYQVVVSHPGYIGTAMVKAEFWQVDGEYLERYPTAFRTPAVPGQAAAVISAPVPAAELATAFCDKLTAFATRPYLKWRDIYDLWWIGTQTGVALDMDKVVPQFLHNLTAYRNDESLPPEQALRSFLRHAPDDLLKQSERELAKWLPREQWELLYPHGVQQMIDYCRSTLATVADAVEALGAAPSDSKKDKSSATRARP